VGERATLFGVPLDLLTMEETVAACAALVESGRPAEHVSLNAGKVVMMRDVPGLRDAVAGCDLSSADGQSVVWAGRLCGLDVPERVAGIDLMGELIDLAAHRGWPVYFLGARAEVLERFIEGVRHSHPALVIAGVRDGYFDDDAAVAEAVRVSGARLLFVGISSPRKELFLAERLASIGPVLAVGVGGSFDVWAGLTSRAPVWMQRSGLEWLYRFGQEPRRMWKRYLVGNARFVVMTVREWWRVRVTGKGR
jgi:N-acetylglucosaminyldiphosphoundecaprenol N-acetyl-beta-D-mannosaminyltransferase